MKQLMFFALRDDLIPLITAVEAKSYLKYVASGAHEDAGCTAWRSALELPQLGEADADSSTACSSFLVLGAATDVVERKIVTNDGKHVTLLDQLSNPDSVTFTPGGRRNSAIISGRISTATDTAASQALMKGFSSAMRKHFVKIKAFYVGPKAERLLDSGTRLTYALQSPPEYDLSRS
jgi:hypothetical protein